MIVETEFRGINSSTEYQVTVQLAEREWSAAQGCSVWGEDGKGGRRKGREEERKGGHLKIKTSDV